MPYINKTPRKEKTKRSRHSNQSYRYYHSRQWGLLRNYYITTHPLCEQCLANGISREAEEVHHIKEFMSGETDADRWQLLLDETNLMSVCRDCHMQIHGERHSAKYKEIKEEKHKY